jgi:O-succinylbenzoic acid--CoA ligase
MTTAPPTFPDWLAHRTAVTPARAALVAGGRTWGFAELDAEATSAARRLAALGVRDGDRVATLLPNGAGPAILVHAALRAGATLVPLNLRLSATELAWQLADAAPRVVVVCRETAALFAEARRRAELPGTLRAVSLDSGGAQPDLVVLDAVREADVAPRLVHDADAVLALIYTSGTTGRPKGAMLTVGNFWWSAVGSALNLGSHADDRWLACLPLFHVGGLSILLRAAIYGITAEVHDGFDAAAVNRALDRDGVTIVSVVAVMLQRMLDERGDRAYPASLRCVLLGGGPAPRPLLERCARAGVPVVQTYGLTEATSQVATLAPEDALRKLGSAGRALYPNVLRIAPDHGGEPRPGEAGEILVRGPVVMAGYAGRPDATAQAIVDGWLHTGDVGYLDADGYLYVLDRRDDLIVTGGENVYPAEVEAVLTVHPWVAEAAVIGVEDDVWGRRVVALVRLANGIDTGPAGAALTAHCREALAGFKVPREIRVVAEPLPRTASGKLRRGELRRLSVSAPGGSAPAP